MTDYDAMVTARRKWVQEFKQMNRPGPELEALAGYARGFFDALDVAASAVIQDITSAAGEKK